MAFKIQTCISVAAANGVAGFFIAILMLIAGIISLISKFYKGMTITAAVFYVFAWLIGFVGGKELAMWVLLCLLFAALLVFHLICILRTTTSQRRQINKNLIKWIRI